MEERADDRFQVLSELTRSITRAARELAPRQTGRSVLTIPWGTSRHQDFFCLIWELSTLSRLVPSAPAHGPCWPRWAARLRSSTEQSHSTERPATFTHSRPSFLTPSVTTHQSRAPGRWQSLSLQPDPILGQEQHFQDPVSLCFLWPHHQGSL